jgi:hypothetical protein
VLITSAKKINLQKINHTTSKIIAQVINIVFDLTYFNNTQTGISMIKDTKFHNHKNNHVNKTDCNIIQKKNIIVK